MTSLTSDGCSGKIRCACQRVNSASLLIDNDNQYQSMQNGLVIYISFTTDCNLNDLPKAASQLANLPICTKGNWGDGSKPQSVREFVKQKMDIGLMIIPQAGLVSKVKGKTLQYRRQASKDKGRDLYQAFCQAMQRAVLDEKVEEQTAKKKLAIPPNVQGSDLFRQHYTNQYTDFDPEGAPTKTIDGELISKSQRKKLVKQIKAQEKKYQKWLVNPEQYAEEIAEIHRATEEVSETKEEGEQGDATTTQKVEQERTLPSHFTFITGTFGNRQGLQFNAECGPFTHSFTFQ